jgi:hypothetical protein
LKAGGRGSSSRSFTQRVLVVAEVALSLVLLISAGLLIASARRLVAVSPGFDPQNLLVAEISTPRSALIPGEKPEAYRARREQVDASFLKATLQKLSSLPGVQTTGAINDLPVTGQLTASGDFSIVGKVLPNPLPVADRKWVSPDYFRAIGLTLVRGRIFTDHDTIDTPTVALINETLANQHFAGEDPVDKQLILQNGQPKEIVGVVKDARQWGLDKPPSPEIYFSTFQQPVSLTTLVIRTSADPALLGGAVRHAVREVNPDAPVTGVRTMMEVIADSLAQARFNTILMSVFAGVALLLAVVGIYGVLAHNVAQRERDQHSQGARRANRRCAETRRGARREAGAPRRWYRPCGGVWADAIDEVFALRRERD